MARLQVILAAVCFGTTGTAQALGPAIEPAAVGAARIVVGAVLLALVALVMRRRTGGPAGGRSGRSAAPGARPARQRPGGSRSRVAGGRGTC